MWGDRTIFQRLLTVFLHLKKNSVTSSWSFHDPIMKICNLVHLHMYGVVEAAPCRVWRRNGGTIHGWYIFLYKIPWLLQKLFQYHKRPWLCQACKVQIKFTKFSRPLKPCPDLHCSPTPQSHLSQNQPTLVSSLKVVPQLVLLFLWLVLLPFSGTCQGSCVPGIPNCLTEKKKRKSVSVWITQYCTELQNA